MSNSQLILAAGSLAALTAVLFGAFGAHALKATLGDYGIDIFKTAEQYHMAHALGLLLIGVLLQFNSDNLLVIAAWVMLAGIVLFSGSLYTLAITGIKPLGMITPIGGLCFLGAWLMVLIAVLRSSGKG